jgi:hypothetical protein
MRVHILLKRFLKIAMYSSTRITFAFVLFTLCFIALWLKIVNNMTYDSFLPGNQSWKEIASEKRCRNMDKIPKDWILPESVVKKSQATRSIAGQFIEDLLDEETLSITKLDVPEIVERTSNGSLTAVKVVTAYSKRAAYAHQLVSEHLCSTKGPT